MQAISTAIISEKKLVSHLDKILKQQSRGGKQDYKSSLIVIFWLSLIYRINSLL